MRANSGTASANGTDSASLRVAVSELTSEVGDLTTKLATSMDDVRALKADLGAKEEEMERMRQELGAKDEEMERMRQELWRLRERGMAARDTSAGVAAGRQPGGELASDD